MHGKRFSVGEVAVKVTVLPFSISLIYSIGFRVISSLQIFASLNSCADSCFCTTTRIRELRIQLYLCDVIYLSFFSSVFVHGMRCYTPTSSHNPFLRITQSCPYHKDKQGKPRDIDPTSKNTTLQCLLSKVSSNPILSLSLLTFEAV